MDRILSMIVNIVMRQVMRKGVSAAMDAGQKAWSKRGERKTAAQSPTIEPQPGEVRRRPLYPDERLGDDVLYPTDDLTEDMQPRR